MLEATQAGEELMSHCTDEDKDLVRDKTNKLLQRYNKLRDQVKDKKQEAEDAAKLSRDFFDAKDQLIAWCDETARKLEAVKGEGENTQQEILKVCDYFLFIYFSFSRAFHFYSTNKSTTQY